MASLIGSHHKKAMFIRKNIDVYSFLSLFSHLVCLAFVNDTDRELQPLFSIV